MVQEDLIRKYKYGYVHSCKLLREPFVKDLLKENQELKKQLEEKETIACDWKDSCLKNAGKIEILENQQKEFIKYLEDEKDRLASVCNSICENKFDEADDNLQKYKEIIGVSDEESNNIPF